MPKQVLVTTAQRDAARMIVQRNEASGKSVPAAVRKIADAEPRQRAVVKSEKIRVEVPRISTTGGTRYIKDSSATGSTRYVKNRGAGQVRDIKVRAVSRALRKLGSRSK